MIRYVRLLTDKVFLVELDMPQSTDEGGVTFYAEGGLKITVPWTSIAWVEWYE